MKQRFSSQELFELRNAIPVHPANQGRIIHSIKNQ